MMKITKQKTHYTNICSIAMLIGIVSLTAAILSGCAAANMVSPSVDVSQFPSVENRIGHEKIMPMVSTVHEKGMRPEEWSYVPYDRWVYPMYDKLGNLIGYKTDFKDGSLAEWATYDEEGHPTSWMGAECGNCIVDDNGCITSFETYPYKIPDAKQSGDIITREFSYRSDGTIESVIWQEDGWDGPDGLGSVERKTFSYDENGFLVEVAIEKAYGDDLGKNLGMKLSDVGGNRRADIELYGDAWTEAYIYSGGNNTKTVVNEKMDGYGENRGEVFSRSKPITITLDFTGRTVHASADEALDSSWEYKNVPVSGQLAQAIGMLQPDFLERSFYQND